MSSVVLSSQRVSSRDALFNASSNKEQAKNDAVNPLVNQDGKLIPSVTRVFHNDRDLYVYLQAYAGAGAGDVTTPVPVTPAAAPGPLTGLCKLLSRR